MGFNITITSKGQMTIPKEMRDKLQVKAGDKCYAWIRNGEIVIVPRNKPLEALAGMLGRPPSGSGLSQEAAEDAAGEAAARQHFSSRAAGQDL